MENFTKEIISILSYLLPGFVTAWIFYSLTSYPRPSQFERVIQALIFTLFVQFFVYLFKCLLLYLGANYWIVGLWDKSSDLTWSIIIAVTLGLIFSYFANNDKLHRFFRRLGITKETSFPSEWFGTFTQEVTFVVLHFHDGRRLYGWPKEWPSDPTSGHFLITDPSWLDGEKEILIERVDNILVNVTDIKWVEFIKNTWDKNNVKKAQIHHRHYRLQLLV